MMFRIMTLRKMTLGLMTFRKLMIISDIQNNDNQYDNTQHNATSIMRFSIMTLIRMTLTLMAFRNIKVTLRISGQSI